MDSREVWQILVLVCSSYFVDGKAFLENYGTKAYEGNAAVSRWVYSYVLPYSHDAAYSSIQTEDQYHQPYVDDSLIFVPDAQQTFSQTKDYDYDENYITIHERLPLQEVGATSGQDLEDYDLFEEESLSKKDKPKNSKPKENKETVYSSENKKHKPGKNHQENKNLDKETISQNEREQDYKSQTVETKPDKSETKHSQDSKHKDKSGSKDSYNSTFLVDVNESSEEFDEPPDMDPLTKEEKVKPPHVKIEKEKVKPPHVKIEKEKVKPPHVKIEKEKAKPPQQNVKPESININTEYDKNEAKPTEKITKQPDSKAQADNTKPKPQEDYDDFIVIKANTKDKKSNEQIKGEPQDDYIASYLAKTEPSASKNEETVKMEHDDPEVQKPKELFSNLNTESEDELETEELVTELVGTEDSVLNDEIDRVLELLNPGEESGRFLSALNSNLWSLIFNQNAQLQKFKKCVTRTNETGSCMNLQFCSIPNIASSLEQLINNACVINDIFIGVCCPDFPVESVKVDWEQSVEVQDNVELSSDVNDCGERSNKAVQEHAWPWKAPLLAKSNGKIFCGGVLISERYVLTAAHCTTKIPRNQILVRLGEHSSTSGEDVPVLEIKRHAQYNPRTMQDDIALLKLARNVKLADFVSLVCLPEFDDDDDFDHNYEGETALLLGWHGIRPGQMKEKDESLTVMNQTTCRNQLGLAISESILCTDARNETERTCNADSGAPLIVKVESKYEVLGVLSWNRNDCDPRFPSTFSSVPHYRKWILRHSK